MQLRDENIWKRFPENLLMAVNDKSKQVCFYVNLLTVIVFDLV